MNILEIDQVSKAYAGHIALNNVSLNIPEGCIFGLLGPNGAGKTSLIRIINQITAPDTGSVSFCNQPIERKHLADIGYLPEERGLYKKMKVGEQALYLSMLKGMERKQAVKALKTWFDKFEITAWWDKKIEDLSKGMAQKVQFITTVVHEPKLLILDEPFSGFDPINADLVKKEIQNLQKAGSTIVLSTHNMSSVEEICEHIALINQSKKVLDGPVKELRQEYAENRFLVHCRSLQADPCASAIQSNDAFNFIGMKEQDGTHELEVKIQEDSSVNHLLNTIIPFGEVREIKEVIPTMHDIFIKTVKGTGNE